MRYFCLIGALIAAMTGWPALASTGRDQHSASHRAAAARTEIGTASIYGGGRAGRRTASGERFDPDAMTCAHRTLPFGSIVRVTNIATGRQVSVRVNDRGPYVRGRVVDLTARAGRALGVSAHGTARVSLEVTAAHG